MEKSLQILIVSMYLSTSSGDIFRHFRKIIHSLVKNKWCYLCTVEISNLNFTNKIIYTDRAGVPEHEIRSILARMMTSSNGNIFRDTDHLSGELTGQRWIPRTKASDAEFWCFLWSVLE